MAAKKEKEKKKIIDPWSNDIQSSVAYLVWFEFRSMSLDIANVYMNKMVRGQGSPSSNSFCCCPSSSSTLLLADGFVSKNPVDWYASAIAVIYILPQIMILGRGSAFIVNYHFWIKENSLQITALTRDWSWLNLITSIAAS